MFSSLKVSLKKYLPFYSFFRSKAFPIYEKRRQQKINTMPEYGKGLFSYGGVTFPLYLSRKNGFVDEEIYWKGCYEEDVLEVIKKELRKGATYVDIGSNIGEHALFAATINSTGRVVAFEPIKRLFDQFSDSIQLNNINHISLHNKACGETEGEAEINFSTSNIGGASIVESTGRASHETISIIKGDSVLLEEEQVNLIKIDTEGFELEVLRGILATIHKHRPKLIIEYSPVLYTGERQGNGLKILDLLEKEGYTITSIDDGGKTHLTRDLHILAEKYPDQVNILCTPKGTSPSLS